MGRLGLHSVFGADGRRARSSGGESAVLIRPRSLVRVQARPPGAPGASGGRSLAGRAPPLHGGGPGFESPRLHCGQHTRGNPGQDEVWRRRGPASRRGAGCSRPVVARESTMMSARWMPRRCVPMKDAATPRKALGTCWQRVIQGFPNGATPPRQRGDTAGMVVGRPRELKHLSTARKREDSRSSGERNGRSPNRFSVPSGDALLDRGRTGCREDGPPSSPCVQSGAERHWNGRPEGVRVP
jgi:hypothetical protein